MNETVGYGETGAAADPGGEHGVEYREVDKLCKEYKLARSFDEPARKQYAIDRRYAAGTAETSWAVDANLLGSYIDILVAYIYARDPEVSIRPTQAAVQAHPRDHQEFANTLEIVISRLWKDGRLKKAGKKGVRSGYAVGAGWLKANMLTDRKPDPVMMRQVNDIRDNLDRIRAKRELIESGTPEDIELEERELERQLQSVESQVEVVLKKIMAIDHVRSEDIQISLDVSDTADYLDANWIANDIYIEKTRLREEFPALTDEDCKRATTYYQQKPTDLSSVEDLDVREVRDKEATRFSTSEEGSVTSGVMHVGDKPVEFAKVVELWDRRDTSVKTFVEGVYKWATPPYQPRYSTSRFYSFFRIAFFDVDGERHPQSLSWRLHKLQDEYAKSRSNFRLTRERSIPSTIVNAAYIDPENARKLTATEQGEYIMLEVQDPETDFRKIFAAKPLPTIDIALFDNAPIIGDMEKISGVQEALQSSNTVEKTATQAEIEQSGFAARTTAQRDAVEDTLSELAQYTAECALQAISYDEAKRYAGQLAMWPENLGPEDVTTLLDVEIEAGSTGRPNTAAEREAWGNVLPLLREIMLQVTEARMAGDFATADALIELIRETMRRFDDRIDVERFIPAMGPPQIDPVTGQPIPLGAGAAGGMPPPGPGAPPPNGQGGNGAGPPATEGQQPPLPPGTGAPIP